MHTILTGEVHYRVCEKRQTICAIFYSDFIKAQQYAKSSRLERGKQTKNYNNYYTDWWENKLRKNNQNTIFEGYLFTIKA